MSLPFKKTKTGVILYVRLTPKASANGIGGIMDMPDGSASLKVSVTAVPEKGKANKALVKLLSKALGLPKEAFEITRGNTDRNKSIAITGTPDDLHSLLKGKGRHDGRTKD